LKAPLDLAVDIVHRGGTASAAMGAVVKQRYIRVKRALKLQTAHRDASRAE